MNEFKTKLARVRAFLQERRLDGFLLSSRPNFAWLSCGRTNHVRGDSQGGVASLFVTRRSTELWTNTIEEKRFREEAAKGLPLTYRVHPWYHHGGVRHTLPLQTIRKIASDDGSDGTKDLGGEMSSLRWSLLPEETARYRKVGRLAGQAMLRAAKRVKRGWTENRLAAELSADLVERGLEASVVLVGSDERLARYRHPIPTPKRIRKAVMMVVCAKGQGLIANLTRIVHFGKPPVDLQKRHQACLRVECAMWEASKPGIAAGRVFRAAVREYAKQGFPGEWEKHHQGGPTGYETRDYLAVPGEKRRLVTNQALAWNPSITGTKSEDTVLLTHKGSELLTPTPGWPMMTVGYNGRKYSRPGLMVRG